jgi:uncharacterized protein (DUF885 family)
LKTDCRFGVFYAVLLFCMGAAFATTAHVSTPAVTPPQATVEIRVHQLHSLFDEQWEYELRADPEFATALGDTRYNDRLSDHSPAFYQSELQQQREFLSRFEAVDPAGLPQQDALSRTLMIRQLHQEIEGAQFKSWEMPVNQMGGPHLNLPDLVSLTPFNTVADYDNYIARLRQIPRVFEQVTANLRQGMKDGLMPPKYLLEKVAAESDDLASKTGDASPFAKPVKEFPAAIPPADQKRLRESVLAILSSQIIPAYQHFAAFVRDEYAPKGRTDPGVWALPDGAARYRFAIRRITTTDLTPEQIHELGLRQIAETETQMLAVAHKLGFNDLASLNDHIKRERSFYAKSSEQVLGLYAKYAREMEVELPRLFGHLPKSKLVVVPMEAARSKNAVPADYTEGAADGSRPGRINVNEFDPEHRLLLNIEAIAYHEGTRGIQPLSRAGRYTPSGWAWKWAATRIPTATTGASKTKCGARSGWSLTPGSTRSTGRVIKWSTTFTGIQPWMNRMSRAK